MSSSGVRLGQFVSLVRGTTYKSALLDQPGPHLLGLASIARDGGFRSDSLRTYGGESAERLLLRPGDLYVSLKDVTQSGDLLGAVAVVPSEVRVGRLTQDTLKLQFEGDGTWRNYVHWALRTPEYRAYCRARATGTTNLALSRDDFLDFELPPLTDKRDALVSTLCQLEGKIELNRRMSRTLDQMAGILFGRWFDVLTPPSSWEWCHVGDAVRVEGGTTPSTDRDDYWFGGTHAFCTPKDMSALRTPALLDTARCVTDAGLRVIGSGLLPRSTVLLSSRAPIGYVAVAERPVAVNQGIIAMVCERLVTPLYMLHWTRHNLPLILSVANGSTFLEVSKGNFKRLPLLVPDARTLAEFDCVALPLHQRLVACERESAVLTGLRGSLLNGLLTGEIPTVPTRSVRSTGR